MRAALIAGNSKSSQWTYDAMDKYFDEVDHLYIKFIDINFSGKKAEILYKGEPISTHYDCLFIKGSFRYAQLLRAVTALYSAEPDVFLVYDSSAYTIAHDKLLTQLVLQQKNLPMPRTYLSATVEAAKNVLSKINYPIIMKFPQGTQGKGVMFADSFASASSILDALDALNQPFLVQEYIETNSSDVRMFVVGNEVVAAMRRKGKGVDKRANIHAGGVGEAFIPSAEMKRMSIEAAKALGAGVCGVDILEGPMGPMIIEVNISPGLQGITAATKVDVADKIAKYLHTQTLAITENKKAVKTKEMMDELDVTSKESRVNGQDQELIMQLDFRGTRILLPEVVSKVASFKDEDSVQLVLSKDKVEIKKFM